MNAGHTQKVYLSTRLLLIISTIIAIAWLADSALWLLSRPATHDCVTQKVETAYRVQPRKIVVRPWLGRHHVFGIFMVPYTYRSGKAYSGVISVESFFDKLAPDSQPPVEHVEDVVAEPGHYLIRAYVPTRTALWLVLQGRWGDLQRPCNWTFELNNRMSSSMTPFSFTSLDPHTFSKTPPNGELQS